MKMMREKDIEFSYNERVILANQYIILEHLDPENAEQYNKNREILENGYECYYSQIRQGSMEEPFSLEKSNLVIDILDMFIVIENSYEKLNKDEKNEIKRFHPYEGFDTHNGNYSSFAHFVIEKGDKFQKFEKRPDGANQLDVYKRMLEVWNEILNERPHTRDLSKEDIKRIMDATIHPENR